MKLYASTYNLLSNLVKRYHATCTYQSSKLLAMQRCNSWACVKCVWSCGLAVSIQKYNTNSEPAHACGVGAQVQTCVIQGPTIDYNCMFYTWATSACMKNIIKQKSSIAVLGSWNTDLSWEQYMTILYKIVHERGCIHSAVLQPKC